jgi:hypothetical protein
MKRWFKRAALLTCGGLIGLVLAEMACRLMGMTPLPVPRERPLFWVYSPHYGWSHRPLQRGEFNMASSFNTTVSINSHGLRDREYAFARTEAARLLVLGDSLTWGFGVNQDQGYTERLESMLVGTEVINGAVSGYSTDQELLWFEREGVRYRPDVVLILVVGNDIPANAMSRVYYKYHKPYFSLMPDGRLSLHNVPVPRLSAPMNLLYHVRQYSALVHNMGHMVNGVRMYKPEPHSKRPPVACVASEQQPVSDPVSGAQPAGSDGLQSACSPQPHPAQDLTVALLLRLRDQCDGIGSDLVVAVTSKFWWPESGNYADFLRRLHGGGFRVVDLDVCPGYDENAHSLTGDPHWNAEGHACMARCLKRYLEDEKILP